MWWNDTLAAVGVVRQAPEVDRRIVTLAISALDGALDLVSAERLQQHLEWFASVRRDTGGPGEDAAADYIRDALGGAGVPVLMHEFDAFLSYPIAADLEVEGTRLPCLTHSFGASTPEEGVDAELVEADALNLHDAAGRIAIVAGLAMPVTVLQATRAGCAGVVFVNEDRVIHNMIATTVWGTPGLDQVDRLPSIPVISVNRQSGEFLRAALGRGAVRARLTAHVQTGWVRSRLPEVRIPGTTESDTFTLIGGHYCAWEVGVTDNATGDACLIEVARILWAHRASLRRGVRVCWWPGHSHGRYSGSTWYADTFFTDLAERCVAYQNVDSPGVRNATWYVGRHTCSELEAYCRGVIADVTGQANAPVHRPARAADQSFLANGVPSFSAYPFLPEKHPDRRDWTGGSANAYWWHTSEDTLDKADAAILAQDTRLAVTAMMQLSNADLLPLQYTATGEELATLLRDIQEKARGRLDLTPALAEASRFTEAARALEARRPSIGARQARTFNTLVMRLGRVLNPAIYSASGRFHHDPADWTPRLRAKTEPRLGGLAKAAALVELDGTPLERFLRAQLTRERNRLVTALRESTRMIEESGLLS
jgi:peptidase M28-like protein